LFVEPWKAVVLLIYIVVYQQVEGQPPPADGL
jgi:putative heme transporter